MPKPVLAIWDFDGMVLYGEVDVFEAMYSIFNGEFNGKKTSTSLQL